MSWWWIFGHLLVLSVEDIKERQLYMPAILELGMTGLLFGGGTGGWILGILMLGVGYISGERIGYGDGWLILALGMWITSGRLVWMLLIGLTLTLLYSFCSGKKELPFVPFLLAGYVLGGWI
ncbi:MAG: prepilin peptidase [Clostridiales bacterium]|nr:prepilin peptidase [Clostridiales bacterium]